VSDGVGGDERADTRSGHSDDTGDSRDAGQSTSDETLRRQQLVVGTAIASLSGIAVVVAGLQQFPGVTPILPFGVGMVTTAATFAVVYASVSGS
jgi:hypothetical protein